MLKKSWFPNNPHLGGQGGKEWFPVVDEDGKTIGRALRSVCHDGKSMLLHPVVHLHLFNLAGDLFLQKRSSSKDIQPGKWDTSVGGHVNPGETIEEALVRETREELGLIGFDPLFLGRYVWRSDRERELVSAFYTISEKVPLINNDEIEEGRYWTLQEIKFNMGKNIFTPNFVNEYIKFLSSVDFNFHRGG